MIVGCPRCGEEIDIESVDVEAMDWVSHGEVCRCDAELVRQAEESGSYAVWDEWFYGVFDAIVERLDEIREEDKEGYGRV